VKPKSGSIESASSNREVPIAWRDPNRTRSLRGLAHVRVLDPERLHDAVPSGGAPAAGVPEAGRAVGRRILVVTIDRGLLERLSITSSSPARPRFTDSANRVFAGRCPRSSPRGASSFTAKRRRLGRDRISAYAALAFRLRPDLGEPRLAVQQGTAPYRHRASCPPFQTSGGQLSSRRAISRTGFREAWPRALRRMPTRFANLGHGPPCPLGPRSAGRDHEITDVVGSLRSASNASSCFAAGIGRGRERPRSRRPGLAQVRPSSRRTSAEGAGRAAARQVTSRPAQREARGSGDLAVLAGRRELPRLVVILRPVERREHREHPPEVRRTCRRR